MSLVKRWRKANHILFHRPQSGSELDGLIDVVKATYSETQLFFGVLGNIDLTTWTFQLPVDQYARTKMHYANPTNPPPQAALPIPRDVPTWFRNKVNMISFDDWLLQHQNICARCFPAKHAAWLAAGVWPNTAPSATTMRATFSTNPNVNHVKKDHATLMVRLRVSKEELSAISQEDIPSHKAVSSSNAIATAMSDKPQHMTVQEASMADQDTVMQDAPEGQTQAVDFGASRTRMAAQHKSDWAAARTHEEAQRVALRVGYDLWRWPYSDITPEEWYCAVLDGALSPAMGEGIFAYNVFGTDPATSLPEYGAIENLKNISEASQLINYQAESAEEQTARLSLIDEVRWMYFWPSDVTPDEFFDVAMARELRELESEGVYYLTEHTDEDGEDEDSGDEEVDVDDSALQTGELIVTFQ